MENERENNLFLENPNFQFLLNFYEFGLSEWERLSSAKQPQKTSEIFDEFFRYLAHSTGYSAHPAILSDEDYNNLPASEIYRGSKKREHISEFLSGNYRPGQGYMGGHFASPNFTVAAGNTTDNKNGIRLNNKNILPLKPLTNNKITKKELLNYLDAIENGKSISVPFETKIKLSILEYFISELPTSFDKMRFFKLFKTDPSKLAIYLGFDYVIDNTSPASEILPNIIILNRPAFAVSESNYKKFVSKTAQAKTVPLEVQEKS